MKRKNSKFTVVGIGEILWDIFPDGRQLGGAPANVAYHAQALGSSGIIVSSVGNDEPGKEIITHLEQLKLDCNFISVDPVHSTGLVTVSLNENGLPGYIIHENAAWDFIKPDERLMKLAGRTDAVCFGSLCQRSDVSGNTVRQFIASTKSGCIKVFDINLRQSFWNKNLIHEMLEMSDILKLNDEELKTLGDLFNITGSETEKLIHLCNKYSLGLIALTKGEKGSRLFAKNKDSVHPGFPVQIADTVGAGDSFTAALILGLLHGKNPDEINEHANRVACFVCSQKGATPVLPEDLVL